MNKFTTIFAYYILVWGASQTSMAGELNNISFDKSILTISHHACQLEQSRQEERQLILQLENCSATAGQLHPSAAPLTQVQWVPLDIDTVRVVANFSQDYQYELQTQQNQYLLCLPLCRSSSDTSLTSLSAFGHNLDHLMFSLKNLTFHIPLEGMRIDQFLNQSIGHLPSDMIRDGLPHFGAVRDDWQGQPRPHEGYDIYVNHLNVIAAAEGVVTRVKQTPTAGLYVKIRHANKLSSVYVHLYSTTVVVGQTVKQGEVIGYINGPAGNAISPQLHFEIQIKNTSVDPLPLITEFYQNRPDILEKINHYQKLLTQHIQRREQLVQDFLTTQMITHRTPADNAGQIPKSLLSQTVSPKKRLNDPK